MKGKRVVLGFLCLVVAVVVISGLYTVPARGQYGNPYVPTNEYGTPDMSQIVLTPAGHYEQCVAFCVGTPLGDLGITMQYDLYTDNYGNTWVVPSPMTVIVGAIWPEYIPESLASRTDGWSYGSMAMGLLEAIGGLEALGITVGGVDVSQMGEDGFLDAIRDFLDMEGDHLQFMIALGLALGGADADWDLFGFELWQISWLYPDNPFDPTDDDPGTATPRPTGTPRPTATRQPTPTPRPTATPIPTVECPPESISQQPPMAEVLDLYPPNPVVQGQGGQGLDVTFLAVSFPVIHRWWMREQEYTCLWWDVATYGVPFDHRGHCCPEDNPNCQSEDYYMVPAGQRCVEYVEAIPDPILASYLSADANLRKGSIEWIESDLAQKYPGARVRNPHLSVAANGEPVIMADGRCLVEAVAHFDFSDPGYYDISVHAQTAGTQYTPPRSIDYAYPTPQPVYLMDTILLR